MADVMLDIVNEEDQIIGQALRSEIHTKGLLHREIHVWFITPDKKIIFQKRAPDKDIAPNLLDATVGGHVELGADYNETAFMELIEETGLSANPEDLVLIEKYHCNSTDPVSGKINNVFRSIYGYLFKGDLSDLKIEEGSGAGFKAYPVATIYNPTQELLDEAIPLHIQPNRYAIFQTLEKLAA
jgi:8-oxo-dGTP pyrophosphatase MutT (NUDIX family)